MSSSTATVKEGGIVAAPSSSSSSAPAVQQHSTSSPSYTFSAEAAPFIPSFMRGAAPTAAAVSSSTAEPHPPQPPITAAIGDTSCENDDSKDEAEAGEHNDEDKQRFSQLWMHCLQHMQGHEVGMLMDMMPPDIQDLYSDKLSDEYLHHDHEHKDKGVHALCAAQKMVTELSPEQLVHIEEFLFETDALNPAVKRRQGGDGNDNGADHHGDGEDEDDDDLFLHHDDGMGVDEEEWLLEQMMADAGHKVPTPTARGKKK